MRDAGLACGLRGHLLSLCLAITALLAMECDARGAFDESVSSDRCGDIPLALVRKFARDGGSTVLVQSDVAEEIRFQERLKKAKAELEARNEARRAAGWSPKSWEEQQVTRLSRLRDMRIRKQELALTRAEFEKARGEVYMQIARDYIRYGYRRFYAYRSRSAPTLLARSANRYYRPYDYWANDRLALRLAEHFANRAARSKGIAAAQEFHANTYYERLIRNSESRIASLQKQVGFAKLAAKAP